MFPLKLRLFATVLAGVLLVAGAGCENDKDSPPDVGLNDINKVVCLGDSITAGRCASDRYTPGGAPFPTRLAELTGKQVSNQGRCGTTSDTGVSRIGSILSSEKPGYLFILYGINDLTIGGGKTTCEANLRTMIQAARANQTIPVVATLLPTYDSHGFVAGEVIVMNERIRVLAKEEKARLVDLHKMFELDRSLIQDDGLHPTSAGNQVIAEAYASKI